MTSRHSLARAALSVLATSIFLAACGGEQPDVLLASARDYLAKKDNKAAIIQIKNALQKNTDLPEARYLLGTALLGDGDAAAAELELRKALDLKHPADQTVPQLAKALLAQGKLKKLREEFGHTKLTSPPSQADLLTTLAMAQATEGDMAAATAGLEKALAVQPGHAGALIAQARIMAASRDYGGAQALLDSVLAQAPHNEDAWKLKGDLLAVQGAADAAVEAYRKALEARPDFVAAHGAVISILLRQGKLDEARGQLEAMKKLAPVTPQGLYLETLLTYQKGDAKAAREMAQQMLRVSRDNPYALQLAGAVEAQLQSWVQAQSYLTKALQIDPELTLARRLLVGSYLESGQPEKALGTLQPVLGKLDGDAQLLGLAGQVYMQNGDLPRAEQYFAKAAALDPKDAGKRTSLALTRLAGGQVEAALGQLEEIAAGDKGSVADLALISSRLRRNDFAKALEAIAALEKKQPGNPMVHDLRGRTLLAMGDRARARESFTKALSVNAVYFPSVASLASLDLADKQPQAARQRFEGVLAADGKNIQALIALADLNRLTGGAPEETATLLNRAITANPGSPLPRLALIQHYLRLNDKAKAVATAQDAVSALPDRPEILDALGAALARSGDTNQALITYGKMAGLQPGSPQPYLRMAELHLSRGNREDAMDSLKKALEVKPDLPEAQRGLVRLQVESGRPQEAMALARDIQKRQPRSAAGFILEGDIAMAGRKWADAATAYRAALRLDGDADVGVKLHAVLLQQSPPPGGEAEKFAAAWLKDHPKDAGFLAYLGERAISRKDYDSAYRYYGAVVEIHPDNAAALNNLAWVAGQKKLPQALDYAEKANRLAPDQAAFMDTLAMLLLDKGDHQRAVELLRKAVELSPNANLVRLNLARALIRNGDKAGARRELEALGKLGDKFSGQPEVTQLLREI